MVLKYHQTTKIPQLLSVARRANVAMGTVGSHTSCLQFHSSFQCDSNSHSGISESFMCTLILWQAGQEKKNADNILRAAFAINTVYRSGRCKETLKSTKTTLGFSFIPMSQHLLRSAPSWSVSEMPLDPFVLSDTAAGL